MKKMKSMGPSQNGKKLAGSGKGKAVMGPGAMKEAKVGKEKVKPAHAGMGKMHSHLGAKGDSSNIAKGHQSLEKVPNPGGFRDSAREGMKPAKPAKGLGGQFKKDLK